VQVSGIAGDPLTYQQWHLRNTGQKSYSQSDEFLDFLVNVLGYPEETAREIFFDETIYQAGEDMNIVEAHAQGAFGQGMIVGVVDSGLEINHPDLQANIAANKSLNVVPDAINKSDPTSTSLSGDHGTSVAGLIAAVAGNEEGGRGVAPMTKVFGVNYLGGEGAQTILNAALSHGLPGSGITQSDEVIAYNRSYGISLPFALYSSATDESFEQYVMLALRDGKGALNVKSAGNSFTGTGNSGYFSGICDASGATEANLSCLNGNLDPSNASFFTVSVAAVNSDGNHTSYSTAGSNVFVSAPAGEYGYAAPAMVTTDQSTCLQGYSSFPSQDATDGATGIPGYFAGLYPFNAPGHPENPSCNNTSTFNGTSSAAPNTSGVVALIGSANPDLSARDIRHILANTSTQVDADDEGAVLTVGEGEFVADSGWVTNAAGYNFNLKYGFGRVDAGEAVRMAKSMSPGSMGQLASTGWLDVSPEAAIDVPDNNAEGASYSFEAPAGLTLEGLQFRLTVANDDFAGCQLSTAGNDLAVEVTSPAGTKTQLLTGRQAINVGADGFCSEYILEDTVFLANAFYGEPSGGEWTVRLVDTNGSDLVADGRALGGAEEATFANNSTPTRLESIAVRAFGHQ
ncbi:MAG: S8 family serine peptidase, partial [Pseudomonadota bacterium]